MRKSLPPGHPWKGTIIEDQMTDAEIDAVPGACVACAGAHPKEPSNEAPSRPEGEPRVIPRAHKDHPLGSPPEFSNEELERMLQVWEDTYPELVGTIGKPRAEPEPEIYRRDYAAELQAEAEAYRKELREVFGKPHKQPRPEPLMHQLADYMLPRIFATIGLGFLAILLLALAKATT